MLILKDNTGILNTVDLPVADLLVLTTGLPVADLLVLTTGLPVADLLVLTTGLPVADLLVTDLLVLTTDLPVAGLTELDITILSERCVGTIAVTGMLRKTTPGIERERAGIVNRLEEGLFMLAGARVMYVGIPTVSLTGIDDITTLPERCVGTIAVTGMLRETTPGIERARAGIVNRLEEGLFMLAGARVIHAGFSRSRRGHSC